MPSTAYPEKLFVETTTHCNMRCSMCVKQAPGSRIPERDMDMVTFEKLADALPHARTLILNGIGEPLLHPHIVDMVRFARSRMPPDASIGFQTNALLLTRDLAADLLDAGLNRMCVSVDGIDGADDVVGNDVRKKSIELHGTGSAQPTLASALGALNQAIEDVRPGNFQLGVEFVLMRSTYKNLPRVIEWAATKNASFALATHVLPYDAAMKHQDLFDPNTDAAREFFGLWQQKAAALGLDLTSAIGLAWKFVKSDEEKKLMQLVADMCAEAEKKGLWLHLPNLVEHAGSTDAAELETVFAEAREIARNNNMQLDLPPVAAKNERCCDFVEDNSAFITTDGAVAPCYFLWHRYNCHMDGESKLVRPVHFGSITDRSLLEIWNDKEFSEFRTNVTAYEYPYCTNCSLTPCGDITGRAYPFEQDCYGINVPCGHCVWCMGGVRCLT